MKQCGVKIVHVHFVFNGRVPVVVSLSERDTRFDTAAGQPDAETARIVVAPVATLRERCTPELAAPPDQCVFKQTALF